jgi:hypothetical protein
LIVDLAVVDLYRIRLTPENGSVRSKKGVRIAKNVRLLRAPLNPNKFAVLVPENKAAELMMEGNSLIATIVDQTKAKGTEFNDPEIVPSKVKIESKVKYYSTGG